MGFGAKCSFLPGRAATEVSQLQALAADFDSRWAMRTGLGKPAKVEIRLIIYVLTMYLCVNS